MDRKLSMPTFSGELSSFPMDKIDLHETWNKVLRRSKLNWRSCKVQFNGVACSTKLILAHSNPEKKEATAVPTKRRVVKTELAYKVAQHNRYSNNAF